MRTPSPAAGRRRGTLAALLALAALLPAAVLAGPPWITVEYPPNPLDAATRDALLVVHAYHHAASVDAELTAVAEGVVEGERHSVTLDVRPTGRPGVYAVRGQLEPEGAWVVVVNLERGTGEASAMVALDRGSLSAVRVPHRMRGEWPIPYRATRAEVESMLTTAVAVARARERATVGLRDGAGGAGGPAAGLALAALLPLGAVFLWRRRST